MNLDELKWLLKTLASRRGRLLYYYLSHGDAACVKDGMPTCPCRPPADLAVSLDREDEIAFELDVMPFVCEGGGHGFRLRAFIVDAETVPTLELDNAARERIAMALLEVL